MKEITFKIPDESTDLITELVEKLGGVIEEKSKRPGSARNTIKTSDKEKIDHTFLFGKWKKFNIDSKIVRQELWRKI